MEFLQALMKLLSLELRQKGPLSREDEAVLHTIIVGDPGTKIVLAKPEL
jgi:hypothetical protein